MANAEGKVLVREIINLLKANNLYNFFNKPLTSYSQGIVGEFYGTMVVNRDEMNCSEIQISPINFSRVGL